MYFEIPLRHFLLTPFPRPVSRFGIRCFWTECSLHGEPGEVCELWVSGGWLVCVLGIQEMKCVRGDLVFGNVWYFIGQSTAPRRSCLPIRNWQQEEKEKLAFCFYKYYILILGKLMDSLEYRNLYRFNLGLCSNTSSQILCLYKPTALKHAWHRSIREVFYERNVATL